jgi:hypothetical protein
LGSSSSFQQNLTHFRQSHTHLYQFRIFHSFHSNLCWLNFILFFAHQIKWIFKLNWRQRSLVTKIYMRKFWLVDKNSNWFVSEFVFAVIWIIIKSNLLKRNVDHPRAIMPLEQCFLCGIFNILIYKSRNHHTSPNMQNKIL